MYDKIKNQIKGSRTISSHIDKLQGFLDNAHDSQLKSYLSASIRELTKAQPLVKKLKKSSERTFLDINKPPFKNLYDYCVQQAAIGKPEWQIEAEHNGWTPPA